MSAQTQLRVIIYDIADNRRRRRVARHLQEKAVRVQESAFEARLSTRAFERLIAQLERLVTSEDSLRFYTVPDTALPRCRTVNGPALADGARFWLM